YITHRLQVAGMSGRHIFAEEAFPVIYRYTGGLPRLINTLCDTALVCAYADGSRTVTPSILNSAIEELQWLPYAKRVNQQRRQPPAQKDAMTEVLREHTRALVNVGNQMARIDALIPALNMLAGRVANLERLLARLAATQAPMEREYIPAPRASIGHED